MSSWNSVISGDASILDDLAAGDEKAISTSGTGTPNLSAVDGVGIMVTGDTGTNIWYIEDIVISDGASVNFPPSVTISSGTRRAYLLDALPDPLDPQRVGGAWDQNRDPNGWVPVGRNVLSVTDAEDAFEDLILTWSVIDFVDTQDEGTDPQVAMDAVQFITPGPDAIDPNAVFFYRGLYTLQLTAEDTEGEQDFATKRVNVRENFPPKIDGNTGTKNRTIYLTDILGPHASGIEAKNSSGNSVPGWALETSDDNYPLNVAAVTQKWRVQTKPAGSFVNFWTTSAAGFRRQDRFV